ncbi:MAG: sulfotransferase [Pseudomonadota bacterium]
MPEPLIDRLFIGAGAMKAGTTWLYSVLDSHPEIYFTFEKEIHYFYAVHVRPDVLSDAKRLENVRRRHLGIDPERNRAAAVRNRLRWAANYLDGPVDDHWYRGLFALRNGQRWAADFSNLYALLPPDAWARVAGRVGDLRVLYTMREPVARLWSHLKFHLKVAGETEALATWSPDRLERYVRQDFIWDNTEYGAAIRRMREGLGERSLHVEFHEAVHANPRAALAGIERFLGIPPHAYPDGLLARRINATDPSPVPAWFCDRFAEDAARIAEDVRAEGFAPPVTWPLAATRRLPEAS